MANPTETPLPSEELQEMIAEADTGARSPKGQISKNVLFLVPLCWTLFQLWYASPLPFMLNIFVRSTGHSPGFCCLSCIYRISYL